MVRSATHRRAGKNIDGRRRAGKNIDGRRHGKEPRVPATLQSLLKKCRDKELPREESVHVIVSMFCQEVLGTYSGTVFIRTDPDPNAPWIENARVVQVADDGRHFWVRVGIGDEVLVAVHPDPDEVQWRRPFI